MNIFKEKIKNLIIADRQFITRDKILGVLVDGNRVDAVLSIRLNFSVVEDIFNYIKTIFTGITVNLQFLIW